VSEKGLGFSSILMATISQMTDPQPQQQAPPDVMGEQQAAPMGPQDFGKWNEKLPEDLQNVLKKLADHYCDEFKYARRMEVMQAWRARSFWREMQHLNWNWDGQCWDIMGPAGVGPTGTPDKNKDTAVLYSTNMYQGVGDSFIAIITQSVPSLRFEPVDPEEAADIETAKIGDDFRKYIQHENDPIQLMTKAAYYAWTDGRLHGHTWWGEDKRTGQERELQAIYGTMEVKVPILEEDQCNYVYLQFSEEHNLSAVRSVVRKRDFEDKAYYKKIKGGSTGNGQDTYERTARISVKQGISLKSAGGDMYSHLCTIQRTWMRPDSYLEDCVEEKNLPLLEQQFPDGVCCEFANGVYIGSKNCKQDDEWTVENIMEGDGSHRNAKGTCLVSVQERANDMINTTQDTYEKCQPAGYFDDKLFDTDAFQEQVSAPGQKHPIDGDNLPQGDTVANHAFFEPAATVSPDQMAYLKELMTDIPEFLTGISAILFGGGGGKSDQSGKALSIQQAAAMGRIGLPFRVLKRFYAKMMEQAIRCAAANRIEGNNDISIGIPDEQGHIEPLSIRVGDLNGNVRCFPDSDENYPESWTSKRQTYQTLMQDQDPDMKAILMKPRNQVMGKKFIGLQELELPDADSWDKQMVEINLLLQSPPNPPQEQPPVPIPTPMGVAAVQPPPAPPTSTIPIDPDWDNHSAEFETVMEFINSPKGQRLAKTNPGGIANVKLHGMEHKQILIQQQMQQMAAQAAANPPKQGPSSPKEATPESKEKGAAQNPAHQASAAPPPAPASGI
jgi:hypothetical protein